ncbi:maltooligosyl trehalose hydrolase [Dyella jiangningensis]|uniref:malto-oligosyltrehalose trehalohydrolase n=1 Tax=Dyella sp. AtDHG13 TaxID=1938897 RepID=UPI00088BC892|nr:malto-oligosyltrehalose trehalohydrolase [Dyella sp. AtDHG13]PXV55874.1 maltooligosyl trehalose hydrolase [Dyella sp. AtDHG13]SDK52788.1 maltooligosyl trehalose hydrolase [Dyella jiangningensis]
MARACWGAAPLSDGHVEFRLWAPAAGEVMLVTGNDVGSMRAIGHGVHACRTDARAGTAYRFRVDGVEVPDPASRAQQGDVDGPSVVVDPQGYRWQHDDWQGRPWHEAVICEVHVGALGGFDAVRQRLPEWRDAGYTAIELMPVGEFPGQRNWGYDGVLPYAPEASYGTPEQLKALVDAAHALGLMVLLDVVYNHLGPSGNALPRYAPRFFRSDLRTPWGDAIDFRQASVRRFYIDNALMWLLEYRMDGLRLDAVHAIRPASFLLQLADEIRCRVPSGRHVHLVLENENNDARLLPAPYTAQWNDDGHNALHVLLTGEHEGYYAHFARRPLTQLVRVLGEGFAFQGQRDRHGRRRGQPSGGLPPTAFVLFLQNHDQIGNRPFGERLIALIDRDRWRAAMALVALCPMVPLFFMGDEWGCATPFYYFTDYHDELAAMVRDGRRNEFAAFSGFADPERRAAIPDPNALSTFEASRPADAHTVDAQATRRWFRHLMELRMQHLVPALADSRALGADILGARALAARWRLGDGSVWTLAFNAGEQALRFHPGGSATRVHLEAARVSEDTETLPPASLAAWHEPSP